MANSIRYLITQVETDADGTNVVASSTYSYSSEYTLSSKKQFFILQSNTWTDINLSMFPTNPTSINITSVPSIKSLRISCTESIDARINQDSVLKIDKDFILMGGVRYLQLKNSSGYDLECQVSAYGEYVTNSATMPYAIANYQSGSTFINTGATAISYTLLPLCKTGLTYTFDITDADGIRINAGPGAIITNGVSSTPLGGYIQSTDLSGLAVFTGNGASTWNVTLTGTWTFSS
jgi:hypothetical protein